MGPGGRRLAAVAIAAFVGLLAAAPAAQASFHEISIREVYAGGATNDSYVVLQAYAAGQNQLQFGNAVTAYDASGTQIGSVAFSGPVANSQNQMTVLVADSSYSTSFPSGPAPDGTSSSLDLDPTGGAVCWAGTIDCMAWGDFSGSLGSPVGSPADPSGIPSGKALRRTIAPNCSTFLDALDDSGASATDFADANPQPRANASAITETACVAPNTSITSATHVNGSRTNDTANSFTFSASPQLGSTSFECKLDGAAFATCASNPQPYSSLNGDASVSGTSHTFQVRAKDANGTDATPAILQWTVDTVAPTISIVNHPADQSPGNSASFTYQANESVKVSPTNSYECSLTIDGAADSFSSCPSNGQTYSNLTDGVTYIFKVRATDLAGNQSTPGSTLATGAYTWTVNDTVPDTTPPETTILAKPSDPSSSSEAAFTYESNESGSSFECKLDSVAFAPCQPSGISYLGLSDGQHTFQVRATDVGGNTDPTPAGYTFDVVLAAPSPPNSDGDGATVPPPPHQRPHPPNTILTLRPPARTHDRTPTFRFRSRPARASYQCRVDRRRFRACHSPFTSATLHFGRHTFAVRAVLGGIVDPTPATRRFKVTKRR